MRFGGSTRWWALGCVVALLGAACGSRLSSEEIRAVNAFAPGAAVPTSEDASDQEDASGAGPDEHQAGAEQEGGDATPGRSPQSGDGGGAVAAATRIASKAPITIGLVGFLSGVGGASLAGARDAWVAWSRSVNARGGINGHPVRLLVGDDGGNANRAVSITRDFVENKGAIAISYLSIGMPIRSYVEEHSIPVVGTAPTTVDWNQSPMLFTPLAAGAGIQWGTARTMKDTGKERVGFLYCVEVTDCGQQFARAAREAGLQVVHESKYSVTQPDFTAECLQFRNAGVEVAMILGDNGSLIRAARACARQGVRPIWVTPVTDDSMPAIPELDGAIAVSPAFPWFLRSGSKAIEEYVAALRTYSPKRLTEGQAVQAWAWVSAKMFERAASQVGQKPTSQDILNGLWSMKGETLGGLTEGGLAITFTRGQPSRDPLCVFDLHIQRGAWISPRGLSPICR